MRRIALWVGAASIAMAQGGPRVPGRVAMLEKKGKPSPDLGAAVVFLEGGGAAAHPVTVEMATSDKEFVPRVLVVPVGSTVRFANRDPFDHNVFSASDSNQFDLRSEEHTSELQSQSNIVCRLLLEKKTIL